MNKSLSDLFIDYQLAKERAKDALEEAGIESPPYSVDYVDNLVTATLNNAIGLVHAMAELTQLGIKETD